MNAERWERIKDAFEGALDSDPEDRRQRISDACEGDPELIAEVDKLLREHENLGDFLATPAVKLAGSLAPGTVIAERYELETLLGVGGMGEVYRARDRLLRETVALKVIRGDQVRSPGGLGSLQREIQAARKVTHPNVCRVFDLGVHNFPEGVRTPLHFLSMELLEGETLQARIERKGRLNGAEALPIAVQVAQALQAAHAAGVIHRDFKSGNVILVPEKDGDRAVVTDFGLARVTRRPEGDNTASLSGQHSLVGTIGYMSPEQLSGGEITPASDIYSLGIVLFEMVTGRLPFPHSHVIQAAVQRVSGNVPSIRQLAPDLDARWERTIRKCLATDPAARPSSPNSVANGLRRTGWTIPRPALTIRHWIGALAALGLLVALAWYHWGRSYRPRPEAERWYEQGVTQLYETTYDAASKELGQAILIDPDYAPSHAYLAMALRELDYPERAKEEILSALALLERNRHSSEDTLRVKAAQFFVSANYDLAQPLIDDLVRRERDSNRHHAMIEQGMVAMYRNQLPRAQQTFENVLKTDSTNAGAQLRIATVYARQRKNDLANPAFERAETLFRAANNFDGVTETLFQWGVFLARANRHQEAISTLEKGLKIAGDMGDIHHQVRLQLALGMAYANLGRVSQAQTSAEEGIQKAIDNKMEHAAAVGLLDLGNVFNLRGQSEMADKYYQQGLDYARQTKARTVEMRATLSLASLRVQSGRPREAVDLIQRVLPYYEQGNFLRERAQALTLLGGAQDQLGRREAEQTLRKAVDASGKLGDAEQSGIAHGYLAVALADRGNLPAALQQEEQSLQALGDLRGGLSAAFAYAEQARIQSQAGLFDKAAESLAGAETRLARLQGRQTQLRAAILNARAQLFYTQRKWAEASQAARQAQALPQNEDDPDARCLIGLTDIWTGNLASGLKEANAAIGLYEQKELMVSAAAARLMLAQALAENQHAMDARPFARASLDAFQSLENWDATWRCRRILQDPAASEALERCRQALGPDLFESYRKRPDLRNLN